MTTLSLFSNHGAVLILLSQHSQITGREIATRIDITESSVRRIISELENEGYVKRVKEGRCNQYRINCQLALHLPWNQDVAIGQLLTAMRPSDALVAAHNGGGN